MKAKSPLFSSRYFAGSKLATELLSNQRAGTALPLKRGNGLVASIILIVLMLLPVIGEAADSAAVAAPVNANTTAAELASPTSAQGIYSGFRFLAAPAEPTGNNELNLGISNPEIPYVQTPILTTVARAAITVEEHSHPAALRTPTSLIVAVIPSEPPAPHRFFDRANVIGFSIHAAIRAADAAQTCVMLGRGAHESWLPIKGCAGIAAYSLSMVPAQIGTSYLLHRHGYYRLEHWLPYFWAAPSAVGIAVSMRAW